MNIEKIVTHAGTFHADEISAIALLLHVYPGTPVERTYDAETIKAAQGDPKALVLDIGRVFEPEHWCLDHHQDKTLPASNILAMEWIKCKFSPAADRPSDRVLELVQKHFFDYISRVDVGDVVEKSDNPIPTISGIIRACNNIPGTEEEKFAAALGIMSAALSAQISTAEKRIESEGLWAAANRYGRVVVHDSPAHIVGWEELAESDGVIFLVTPNARGGYQITTCDSEKWPIPPFPTQTFRHNSGFLAAYPTLNDCLNHLQSMHYLPE